MNPAATRLRIACGQLAAHDLDDARVALDEAVAMVERAGAEGAQLCVLPEATYPAYVLGSAAAARAVIAAGPDPVECLAAAARDAGCTVVAGVVLEADTGLENAAVMIDATGTVRARAGKRFLWHFDREWFTVGRAGPVVDGIGTLVCADARLPEIGLDLVARGARVIANPTAWVTSQPPPAGTNSQAEFLWRVRALENHVVAVAATKVGTEGGTVIYSGGSQIVDASGRVVARGAATEPELVIADVELPERSWSGSQASPSPTPQSPARAGRAATSPLVQEQRSPTDAAPAPAPRRPPLREGYVQVAILSDDDLLDRIDGHGVDLVVGPRGVVRNARADLAVATFADDELVDPRPARAAALDGVECIVWLAHRVRTPLVEEIARTRALENRVFVLVWRAATDGGPLVADPSGAVIARAAAARFVVQTACLRAATATKVMAPGTDAWDAVLALGREP
ncbi:MAG TPA: nitrilase-related carbon-nitrogen hydrolase [Acidimicrobiia bacterium]|nr:nitrilase-related carbon-nitrogen hydrolase [Acidimicrobiia bacterium]